MKGPSSRLSISKSMAVGDSSVCGKGRIRRVGRSSKEQRAKNPEQPAERGGPGSLHTSLRILSAVLDHRAMNLNLSLLVAVSLASAL